VAERQIPFAKAHALGNDFLLVEASDVAAIERDGLAKQMCDRHAGIGADGLVILGVSTSEDASFRIYNADGSEATLSGNALRCAAAWLMSRKGSAVSPGAELALATRVGARTLYYLGRSRAEWLFRAEMGKPCFAAAEVPFRPPRPAAEPIVQFPLPVGDATLSATILSMGNPQCIMFLDEEPSLDWMAVGPEIERHPFFPDRTNVGFVRVHGRDRIEARFWERGAGHTLASGTGSCACAIASHLAGKTGRRATVEVERGAMEVNWREDGVVELTGPAEMVAEGTFIFREALAKAALKADA
jgi:diaminopimelate epimerase